MGLFTTNPVLDMLKHDHKKVQELFEQFESADDSRSKASIVDETLRELDVHATLEEKLIYPAIRKSVDQEDLMDEALEEHHVVHVLIGELRRMRPRDSRYEAKFTVLGESVKHHVKEEEGTMFPEAENAEIDWEGLNRKVVELKHKLLASMTKSNKRPNTTTRRNGRSRGRRLKKAA